MGLNADVICCWKPAGRIPLTSGTSFIDPESIKSPSASGTRTAPTRWPRPRPTPPTASAPQKQEKKRSSSPFLVFNGTVQKTCKNMENWHFPEEAESGVLSRSASFSVAARAIFLHSRQKRCLSSAFCSVLAVGFALRLRPCAVAVTNVVSGHPDLDLHLPASACTPLAFTKLSMFSVSRVLQGQPLRIAGVHSSNS